MREDWYSRGLWGETETTYRMKCDVCGKYVMNPPGRGGDGRPMFFHDCGEAELAAASQGWSMDSSKNRHVCPRCMEEMAGKGIKTHLDEEDWGLPCRDRVLRTK